MSLVDRMRPRANLAGGRLALWVSVLLCGSSTSIRAEDPKVPVNQGGILVVHDHGVVAPGTEPDCDRLDLRDLNDARVEVPFDSSARLIGVYAAFAPEDSVFLAGVTFGIQFSSSIRVVSQGACGNQGMELGTQGWPADREGVASLLLPFQTGAVTPIYWFLVSASAPGWFEVTPHPSPEHAGAFGSGDPAPKTTPITGYGRLGIGTEGRLPEVGIAASFGACCLDECFPLSPLDCAWFTGLWLGSDADCEAKPCDPDGATGACCVGVECSLQTRLDCAILGGRFFGEGKPCEKGNCIEQIDVGSN